MTNEPIHITFSAALGTAEGSDSKVLDELERVFISVELDRLEDLSEEHFLGVDNLLAVSLVVVLDLQLGHVEVHDCAAVLESDEGLFIVDGEVEDLACLLVGQLEVLEDELSVLGNELGKVLQFA
jgi:hypothetical protein